MFKIVKISKTLIMKQILLNFGEFCKLLSHFIAHPFVEGRGSRREIDFQQTTSGSSMGAVLKGFMFYNNRVERGKREGPKQRCAEFSFRFRRTRTQGLSR